VGGIHEGVQVQANFMTSHREYICGAHALWQRIDLALQKTLFLSHDFFISTIRLFDTGGQERIIIRSE